MNITLDKQSFYKTFATASKFVSSKTTTTQALQGVYLGLEGNQLQFCSTDLNSFYRSYIEIQPVESSTNLIVDPKKILEFTNLLQTGDIEVAFEESNIRIKQGKIKGTFPAIINTDFPFPPETADKEVRLKTDFLQKHLPLILFTASSDESRPVLTGINFTTEGNDLLLASTDGFRLSLIKTEARGVFGNMIVPSSFLREMLKSFSDEEEISFLHSEEENLVLFHNGKEFFYSRLIDGEFPPFDRVIPSEKEATARINSDELQRNIKIISVFARDHASVIVCEFAEGTLRMRPKQEGDEQNQTIQDIEYEGPPLKVAFNYRYLLDFLQNAQSEEIIVELLRADAPVVFKSLDHTELLHIIMPVRINE